MPKLLKAIPQINPANWLVLLLSTRFLVLTTSTKIHFWWSLTPQNNFREKSEHVKPSFLFKL